MERTAVEKLTGLICARVMQRNESIFEHRASAAGLERTRHELEGMVIALNCISDDYEKTFHISFLPDEMATFGFFDAMGRNWRRITNAE